MKVYQDFFYYKEGIYHHSKLGDNHLYAYHAVSIIKFSLFLTVFSQFLSLLSVSLIFPQFLSFLSISLNFLFNFSLNFQVRIIGWGEEKVGRLPMKFWVVANTWGHWWGNKGGFLIPLKNFNLL